MDGKENSEIEFLETRMEKIKDLFRNDYVLEAINLLKQTGTNKNIYYF